MCQSEIVVFQSGERFQVEINGPGSFHYRNMVDYLPEGSEEKILQMVDAFVYTNRHRGEEVFPLLSGVLDVMLK